MAIGKLFSPQTLKMVSTLGKAPSPPDGLGPFIGCRAAIRERQPQRKLSPPRRALQRGSLEATEKLRGFGAGPRIGMGGYREKIKRGSAEAAALQEFNLYGIYAYGICAQRAYAWARSPRMMS